jgi:hypothetical protein
MKKLIIISCAVLLHMNLCAQERTEALNERYARYDSNPMLSRQTKSRDALSPQKSVAEQIDDMTRLKVLYADAFKQMRRVDEFSYFGFKLEDVKAGRILLEEFLKEFQDYINSTQR